MTVRNCHHRDWENHNLPVEIPLDEAAFCNQQDDCAESTCGEWFLVLESPVVCEAGSYRVIVSGTFANDHSPGASYFTTAELYDVSDADDMEQFERAVKAWEAQPEYIFEEEETCLGEDDGDL